MTSNEDALLERDDIEMLLPWYVTGRLEPADAARVEAYLARHPDMLDRLELMRKEQTETRFLNRSEGAEPATSAPRFMAEVVGNRSAPPSGAMAWIRGLFDMPASGAMRWAAAAAVFVILVQAAAIIMLTGPKSGGDYIEAGGEQPVVTTGSFVLIRFADNAPAADIAAMLSELSMEIVEGPKPGGLFKLRIGPKDMSAADREGQVAALTGRGDLVMFVTGTK
ncbi:MAG: anti-sigma factor family protein [Hyphomicrobiales bacterium]